MNLILRQLTKELEETTRWGQQLEAQVKELESREVVLKQIIDALFELAQPGSVKSSLWRRYQGLDAKQGEVQL